MVGTSHPTNSHPLLTISDVHRSEAIMSQLIDLPCKIERAEKKEYRDEITGVQQPFPFFCIHLLFFYGTRVVYFTVSKGWYGCHVRRPPAAPLIFSLPKWKIGLVIAAEELRGWRGTRQQRASPPPLPGWGWRDAKPQSARRSACGS
jgi:hypothetical protein